MTIIKLTTESRSRRKKSFRVRCNPRLVRETCFRYCRNTKRVAFSAIGAQRSELNRPLRAGRPAHVAYACCAFRALTIGSSPLLAFSRSLRSCARCKRRGQELKADLNIPLEISSDDGYHYVL